MKNLLVIFITVLLSTSIFAQSEKYTKAMTSGLEQLASAKDADGFQKAANTFERIANVEKKEWLPSYYQAQCHMQLAVDLMQKKQLSDCLAHVEKAQSAIDKAKEIAPEESEVWAMQGYIYQGRIWENPMTKGAEFSPLSHQALDKAISLNPENPRAFFLKGQNVLFTPVFYGGGAETALPLLQKANEKFANFKPESPLHPTWGAEQTGWLIKTAEQQKSNANN